MSKKSEKEIFILGMVLIALAIGSYILQIQMELRKIRAQKNISYFEYTLTNLK